MKYTILLFILLAGCKNLKKTYYQDKLAGVLHVNISSDFKIVEGRNIDFAIGGDYIETFKISVTKKEYNRIFNIVKPKRALILDYETYGVTLKDKEGNRTSVIFDPEKFTLKYTYSEE